ncbi:hypothetical protein F2Q69_00001696 [Brassica cretica]|uniref:Uncharacterized protein n=1 Tax=Brassica cretica TaxID=69181 RepID=A0A8S9P178_BRACR|nr:hypothetical protein F2Q69_00001696 [Brassica cretica]
MFFLSLSVDPRIAQERIREKREEMNRLQRFVDENDNLISLVKKLPEKLHHNIMASRLIHTNECLVFLGENYYTDRTLKQTVDVLRRRDKTLQSQIHSLKAEIDDFQTEASFFANTSSEAAEFLRLEKSIKKKKKILELCFSQYAEESELDVVNGLGDKTNGNRIGYEEFVLEKPQYLKKEDQSRGGIPQQNAETLRDFQATSRGKASSSVVGPQKIESPIQKLESKFDTNKVTYLSLSQMFASSIVTRADLISLLNICSQPSFRVSAIKTGFKIQGTEKVEQAVRSMYKFVWLAF